MPEKIFTAADLKGLRGVYPYMGWTPSGYKAPCLGLAIWLSGEDIPIRIRIEDVGTIIRNYIKRTPIVISKKSWKSAHYYYFVREATPEEAEISKVLPVDSTVPKFNIWSLQMNAWFTYTGSGYTTNRAEALALDLEEATRSLDIVNAVSDVPLAAIVPAPVTVTTTQEET